MNTKNVLMFVALSIGMLTALTATVISQLEPAFADKKKCEDNSDNSCNDETQKVEQENNCKIENENKDNSDHNANSNELICTNLAVNPGHDGDLLVSSIP